MPSIQPLDLVILSKDDYIVIACTENYIVIPSIKLLNLIIPSTENCIVISCTKDCIVILYQLHCDSFYKDCIVIPFTNDLALGLTLSILLQRIAL